MLSTHNPETDIPHLAMHIKPLVRTEKGLFFIEPKDVMCDVYFRDYTVSAKATGLKPLMTIETHHKATLPNLFRPSISEILNQIPHQLLGQVSAFEVNIKPQAITYHKAARQHHTHTILYTGKLPQKIMTQDVIIRGQCYPYSSRELSHS